MKPSKDAMAKLQPNTGLTPQRDGYVDGEKRFKALAAFLWIKSGIICG
jgi:hypothetical protein